MKRYCDCGCRRPAITEFMHPSLGVFWFGAICTNRNRPELEAQGFMEFGQLDDRADEQPTVTHIGGGPLDAEL